MSRSTIAILVIVSCCIGVTVCQDRCSYTWVAHRFRNIVNGTLQPGVNTVDGCQEKCLQNPKCTGFDFDSFKDCWLILFDDGTLRVDVHNRTTHYQLIKNKNSCNTYCRDPNSISWAIFYDGHINGALLFATEQTLQACWDRCLATSTCRGFDWDTNAGITERCWFIFTNNSNPIQTDSPGVNHYQKRFNTVGYRIVTPVFIGGGVPRTLSDPMQPAATTTSSAATTVSSAATTASSAATTTSSAATITSSAATITSSAATTVGLLVIIAIIVISNYPMKDGKDGKDGKGAGGGCTRKREDENSGELHTRRPKSLKDE